MRKIRETRPHKSDGGFGYSTTHVEQRVVEIALDAPLPAGAEEVDTATALSGWTVIERQDS